MDTILPETYVHATFVLGEIEVNPKSQGGSGRIVSPNQGIILFVCFFIVKLQT